MNNWINRLAIFAVVGAILSSAVLVGCGGNAEDDTATNGTMNSTTNGTAMSDENSAG